MSFLNWLTLLFVAAKLFELIDWSWWVVFSPTLFNIALIVLIMAAAATSKGNRL
jgi:hypothetical protein